MDRSRLLELAIEGLEKKKMEIDAEIEAVKLELRGYKSGKSTEAAVAATGRRRPKTAAERKAQSDKMRKVWAERKKQTASKPSAGKKADK